MGVPLKSPVATGLSHEGDLVAKGHSSQDSW